jgi:tryptophan halogenase
MGNAVGFVEPLEATSLQVICLEASSLADSLIDSLCEPTPSLVAFYNVFNGQAWEDIRDFLAVHHAFNTRLDTPFWVACRNDTKLHGAQPIVDFYGENGPSKLAAGHHLHAANSFGMDGYLALLLGQNVPHGKRYVPTAREADSWRTRSVNWMSDAKRGMDVRQSLDSLRKRGFK